MSALGVSTLALAGVYAAVGGHALVVWGGRRSDRVVGVFGLVCLSMAVYALGSTALTEAHSVAEAGRAQTLQLIAASVAAALYIPFCSELRGGTPRWVYPFGLGLPITALLLTFFGGLVVPQAAPTGPTLGYPPNLVQAELTLGGELVQAWLLSCIALAILLAYCGEDRQRLRPPVWAPAAVVSCAAFDIWAENTGINTVYLSEYAFLVLVIGVSQRLIARARRVSRALSLRTAELEASTQRIEATHQARLRREQLAAVGELSAIVAHELRNPLAIIGNASTSLGRARPQCDDWLNLVEVLDEEADRLDRLVDGLLTYSQPLEPRVETLDTARLLAMATERARHALSPDAKLRLEVRDHGGRCDVDAELLCQALCNLIENAHPAMPGGGTVTVSAGDGTRGGRPTTLLQVTDDGPGMPAPLLERVRELFFTTRQNGTGLGLGVVERVVQAHGGEMEIDSVAGRGTTISLHLPRRIATAQAAAPTATPEAIVLAHPEPAS